MSDPISGTPAHYAYATAAAVMKRMEPAINTAQLLHQALTIGQAEKDGSPWTDEQKKVLLDKYYETLINL